MKFHLSSALLLATALLLPATAHAQFQIDWYTIDGGGGTSTGGSFSLTGTIGQCDAGPAPAGMSGASFALDGGFWGVSAAPPCRADFNHDGQTNSQDFFDFLAAFFALAPAADFNRDGAINSQDFFDFLAAFFAGC
jgi:hypothetical protein